MNFDRTAAFDRIIDRRGTRCQKWDMMEARTGVSAEDGLAMWVADIDFQAPQAVRDAARRMADHGIFGYLGDEGPYREAIRWWMEARHGWRLDPAHIFTTHGLTNGLAVTLEAFTEPGDGIVLTTPVYHAFARVIRAGGREVVEMPLRLTEGRYEMDFAAWDSAMTGRERMIVLSSPHNPGGRVWTTDELRGVADFARRHDLILVSDEIHHDLVFSGRKHVPMPVAAPDAADRLVMMTAASKTFPLAGSNTGNVIIADEALRRRFAARMHALSIGPNAFGPALVEAAYSPEGAVWVDALVDYLDGNRRLFDAAVAEIPGLASMPLEATYLSWIDFSRTGMTPQEFTARVERDAKIAVNRGTSFGTGGENWLRFNIATPRARVQEAAERLRRAFADLQ